MITIRHYDDIAPIPVDADGAKNARKRLLVGAADGVPYFSIRMFTISPGGNTPSHAHDFEHEIYILEGTAKCVSGSTETPVRAGSVIFVPGGEPHCFVNTGSGDLVVLCMVPKEYE